MYHSRHYELSNGDELIIADRELLACRHSHEIDAILASRLQTYNSVNTKGCLRADPPFGSHSMKSVVPVIKRKATVTGAFYKVFA